MNHRMEQVQIEVVPFKSTTGVHKVFPFSFVEWVQIQVVPFKPTTGVHTVLTISFVEWVQIQVVPFKSTTGVHTVLTMFCGMGTNTGSPRQIYYRCVYTMVFPLFHGTLIRFTVSWTHVKHHPTTLNSMTYRWNV